MNKEYTDIFLQSYNEKDGIKVNGALLVNAIVLFTSAAKILNEVNQKSLNDKQYDRDSIAKAFEMASHALNELNGAHLVGEYDEYDVDPQIFHGILGIGSLSGELAEALLQVMLTSHDFKVSYNILNEIGDIAKFQTLVIDALDGDWDHVLYTSARRAHLERKQ